MTGRPSPHPQSHRARPVVASIVGLLALCTCYLTPGVAASAATTCSPPGQQRSATIARADRADGSSEVTEYSAGGEYRVTRCATGGALIVSQTVSPIADPDGGVALVPTTIERPGVTVGVLYGEPTEPSWAAAFRAGRAALNASVIPPTAPLPAAPVVVSPTPPDLVEGVAQPEPSAAGPNARAFAPGGRAIARAAVAGDACTNTQFTPWMSTWTTRNYDYRINRERFNFNDTTVASLVHGHTNWDTTRNSCGLSDITNLSSHYLGSTTATIHSNPDGQSITDRGDLSSVGCAGALACTWLFTGSTGASSETDQRFSDVITFSNVGAAGAYDYESVATHESGHSIGLDHANSSDALTMYYSIRSGTTYVRTLAKGDVLGLRARYP